MKPIEIENYLDWVNNLHDELLAIFRNELKNGDEMSSSQILKNMEKKENIMQEITTAFKTIEESRQHNGGKNDKSDAKVDAKINIIKEKLAIIIDLNLKVMEIFGKRKDKVVNKLNSVRKTLKSTKEYKWLSRMSDRKIFFDSRDE